MGHTVTWLVLRYSFRIDGGRECKSGARAEHIQKPDSGYVDLDFDSLANLLAKPVGKGMGNIMGHAPVKGLGDLTSGRSGTSMPISHSAAVSRLSAMVTTIAA